jgi:molybdopterin adenylyltransferase
LRLAKFLPVGQALGEAIMGNYSSRSAEQHRQESACVVACGVVTVSDTRTLETDLGGQTIVQLLEEAGHQTFCREIVADEPTAVRDITDRLAATKGIDVVLITGGTGIGVRDQTPEAIDPLLTKRLPGYGELLRMLSYQEIGPAAMLSRAAGGLIGTTVVLTIPGSPAAVRLAMDKLILPEVGHLVMLAKKSL